MIKAFVFLLMCALLAVFMLTIRTFSIIPVIGMIGVVYCLWWPFDRQDKHDV